jgi:hypothetical protein
MRFLVLKNILVATDLEVPAYPAIRTAAQLANAAGASLHVACVLTAPGGDGDETVQTRARAELSAILVRAGATVNDVTIHVLSGDPAFAIRSLGDGAWRALRRAIVGIGAARCHPANRKERRCDVDRTARAGGIICNATSVHGERACDHPRIGRNMVRHFDPQRNDLQDERHRGDRLFCHPSPARPRRAWDARSRSRSCRQVRLRCSVRHAVDRCTDAPCAAVALDGVCQQLSRAYIGLVSASQHGTEQMARCRAVAACCRRPGVRAPSCAPRSHPRALHQSSPPASPTTGQSDPR